MSNPETTLSSMVQAAYRNLAAPPGTPVEQQFASIPDTGPLARFDQLQAARGNTSDAFAAVAPSQILPVFNPLTTPVKGMFSALQPSALQPGQFALLQDLRFDDGALMARYPTVSRSVTGLPGLASSSRGLWSGRLNGTVHVVGAWYDGSKVGIYYSTDGIAFSAATQSTGAAYSPPSSEPGYAAGDNRLHDYGVPISFQVVNNLPDGRDYLLIQDGHSAPRVFSPAALNGSRIRPVQAVSAPAEAGDYPLQLAPPCFLPVMDQTHTYGGSTKPYTVTAAGGFSSGSYLNGEMQAFNGGATSSGDSLTLAWSTPVSFGGATQLCFLVAWSASGFPANLLANYKIQIHDTVGGTQTVFDPASSSQQFYSYEQANTSSQVAPINGGIPGLQANLITFSLGGIAPANMSSVTEVLITAPASIPAISWAPLEGSIVAIFGGAATGQGALYGTSPLNRSLASYTVALANSGSNTESPGVVVQPASGVAPYMAGVGAYNFIPGWDQVVPAFQFVQWSVGVPFFNPASADLANGVDTLNVYRQDVGSSDYIFAFSQTLASYSGGTWTLANPMTSVQYATDDVSYLSLISSRFAPDAYSTQMPIGSRMAGADGRLFVGGPNQYAFSEYLQPFRFRPSLQYQNGAPVARSAGTVTLPGQSVQAFATPSGSALASSTVYFWTETKTYAVGGFDGFSLSRPSTVAEVGCSAPGSVAQYKDAIFFVDDNRQLRRFGYGRAFLYGYSGANAYDLMPAISRRVVDDQTTGIPAGRLPWVQGVASFDRYYLAYTGPGRAANDRILLFDELVQGFVQDTLSVAADAVCYTDLSGGRVLLIAGADGGLYTHENQTVSTPHAVALAGPEHHKEMWQHLFFGRVGLVCDVQSGQTASVTKTIKPNQTDSSTIDLATNAVGQVWRWDSRATSTQPGLSGVSCQISLSLTMTPGTHIYSLVMETRPCLSGADQL